MRRFEKSSNNSLCLLCVCVCDALAFVLPAISQRPSVAAIFLLLVPWCAPGTAGSPLQNLQQHLAASASKMPNALDTQAGAVTSAKRVPHERCGKRAWGDLADQKWHQICPLLYLLGHTLGNPAWATKAAMKAPSTSSSLLASTQMNAALGLEGFTFSTFC